MPRKNKRRGRKQRRRYVFTRADCQKGFRAAVKKFEHDPNKLAWFLRRVRSHYDERRRKANGEDPEKTEERRARYFGDWYGPNGCSRDPQSGDEPPF